MDDLLSEKEQIERMRTWWSDYGYYVLGGVVLGALILFSFNYFQNAKRNAEIEASALYDTLSQHIADGDLDAAEATSSELDAEYGNSAYAAQSKLAMARLYMDKNRDEDAATSLRSLLDMDGFENLKHIGRIRLAKIMLYQREAGEALALLEGHESGAFAARYAETLGDAYFALGRIEEARASYQAALREPVPTIDQGFVQLKLQDLPDESGPVAEPPPDDAGRQQDDSGDSVGDGSE